jgi:hypothetical protein
VQAELEAAVRELSWGAEPPAPGSASEWLADELDGWLLQRELAREKLVGALAAMLERTARALGPRFEREVSEFLALRGAGSRQLQQVMLSFVEHARERWQRDASLPAYLCDLARHEALELELAAYPSAASAATEAPLELDAGLAFDPTCRVVRYDHAVRRADDEAADWTEPERRRTVLFAFRDREHDVRWRELDAGQALLLEGLLAGRSLRACVESVRPQIRDHGSLVLQCAHVLAELAEQGAIVGPCPAVN